MCIQEAFKLLKSQILQGGRASLDEGDLKASVGGIRQNGKT